MNDESFDSIHPGKQRTFAETTTDEKMDWLADYLDTLALQAFSAEVSGAGVPRDLGRNLEMAGKILRQAHRQEVAENHALHDRLAAHGDHVVELSAHDLTVYFEPDGTVAKTPEGDSHE